MENKKLILSLIKDNLIHNKMLIGFNNMGFCVSNYFHLALPDSILLLMDVTIQDNQLEDYLKFFDKVKHINIEDEPKKLNNLSEFIFNQLWILKQQQLKK